MTGDEIRFIRTYFELSKRKLADKLNVSHTAVNKWEAFGSEKAKMDIATEILLRAFVKLQLNEDKDFSNFYRGVMDEAKRFSETEESEPLRIAC